jgi:N-terminal domain of toast_rack, DUF2154
MRRAARTTAGALAALAAMSLATSTAGAQQDMRTLRVTHSVNDSLPMHVDITYGVGTLTLQPATRSVLYDVRLIYSADRTAPQATFNPTSRTLQLGIKDGSYDFPSNSRDSGGALQVQLARGVPLDLSLKIGAAEATLQLGGLAIRNLTLKGGATQTTLRFDSLNTIPMQSLDLKVGAAEFQAHGLANARATHMRVEGAAGDIELWFDGTWTGDVTLDSKILFGEMKIHVPPDVQVLSTAKAVLGNVDDNAVEHSTPAADSDMSDSDSSDSNDDDSDSSATAKAAAVHPQPKPQPKVQVQPGPQPHRYTLRITGTAAVGSLEILHDAATSH